MTQLPFKPPCNQCRGYGFIDGSYCQACGGRGFNPLAETVNEDHGRIEIRDRHEEQIAGLKVMALCVGAVSGVVVVAGVFSVYALVAWLFS